MSFKKQLQEFKKLNTFNLYDLVVAEEMDFLSEEVSDSDFEILCQVAKNAHLKSEYCSIQQVVNAIYQLLQDGCTVQEIAEYDYFDILEIAAEY
jgi:hypothetical protein